MKGFMVLACLVILGSIVLGGCVSPTATSPVEELNLPVGIDLIPQTDELDLWNPLWSPDGEKIVAGATVLPMPHFCLGCESPYSELFLISPSTYGITSLLRAEHEDFFVRGWLSDGKTIAVQSGMNSLGKDAFLIDVNDATLLSPPKYFSLGTGIDWSHDGKQVIVFDWVSYKRRVLKIIDLVTDEETLLYTITGADDDHIELSEPSLSPDNKTIAFSYGKSVFDYRFIDTEIYFLNIETKQLIQFTHDSSHDNDSPIFSPDGKLIAYQKFYQDSLDWRTVVVELDSSCEWEIPLPGAYTSSWAPDSRRLVIGGDGIYIVNLYELFGDEFGIGTTCP